jgi:NADH dehydrogenase/NADH:ubiquinone oxidoreductase subunit G
VKIIAVTSQNSELTQKAMVAIPTSSFSEYSGCIINVDNILQSFSKAVTKNEEKVDMIKITNLLGGPIADEKSANSALKKTTSLNNINLDQIPAEGYKLNNSEV